MPRSSAAAIFSRTKVRRVVESAPPSSVGVRQPPKPDDHHQGVTGTDCLADGVSEVDSGSDGVDVPEDVVVAEMVA